MGSNVRLLTNVLCVEREKFGVERGKLKLSIDQVIAGLGYFELIEYKRVNPNLFTLPNYQLTDRQRWEMEGPRGRNNGSLTRLWSHRADLSPMPARREPNPFFPDIENETVPELSGTEHLGPEQEAPSEVRPDAMLSAEELISDQNSVITAGADQDILVVAPPGTGKTHVLVERIAYLVDSGMAANPLEEILVLSFTRSAVAEVKKRLIAKVNAGGHENMLYAQIRTFDSLATQLLKVDLPADQLVSGYGERIAQFNRFLANRLPQAEEKISKIRFLLVDEVQDLNGARAEMVLELSRRVNIAGGCSVFLGDPAQAIYDFSESLESGALTSVEFLGKLIHGHYCGRPPRKVEFSEYRRFETPMMLNFVRIARSAMGEDGLSPDGSKLDALLMGLGDQLALNKLREVVKLPGRKALLAKTNLETYWLWEHCKREGIQAQLWRGASGNYWPGWLGRLVLGFLNDVMSIEVAKKRWDSMIRAHVAISFTEALGILRDQGLYESESGQIQVAMLNSHINNSAPVQQTDGSCEDMIISTIHRSKGLEFENVFLYAPEDNILGKDDEVRVVYVAATRAKRTLQLLSRDSAVVKKGAKNSKYRNLKTSCFHIFKYPSSPSIGLLIDGSGIVDAESILGLDNPLESQKAFWSACFADIPRNIEIRENTLNLDGVDLGELKSGIKDDVSVVSRYRRIEKPVLQGLKSIGVATVALDQDNPEARRHLGAACLGLVPVVTGIVSI